MTTSRNNRTNRFYPRFLTGQRILVLVLVAIIAVMVGILLSRPAPTAADIAREINGSQEFQRPSAMEYVPKTNSCIVGGTVTSAEWYADGKTVSVGAVDGDTVDYTSFGFKSDDGQVFTVSENGALYVDPGENLGLELHCERLTMKMAPSFGMIAIIYGGK